MFSSVLQERTRREVMKLSAAGVFGASLSGWMKVLANAAEAPATKPKHKSCILLWMEGGASHKDTFDLKPDSKGAGDFKPIATSAPGVQISEHLPKLAKLMHTGVIVRGMSTPEGAHGRAKYYGHTGYREGQGGITYPSLGAIASQELGSTSASVPNFVAIGGRSYGSGFLGPKHQPLQVQSPDKGVEDLKAIISEGQFNKRVGLLQEMESAFFKEYKADAITDHKTAYERAVKLMQSKEAKSFDLALEPAASRAKYGTGRFADGVLMARRLVEIGVPFIEVSLGGWDTHQDNFERVKKLSGEIERQRNRGVERRGLVFADCHRRSPAGDAARNHDLVRQLVGVPGVTARCGRGRQQSTACVPHPLLRALHLLLAFGDAAVAGGGERERVGERERRRMRERGWGRQGRAGRRRKAHAGHLRSRGELVVPLLCRPPAVALGP